MPTGQGGTPSRRRSQWKNCCFADIGKSSMPTSRISWEHTPYRTNEIGSAPGCRPACAASDQDVAGVLCRGGKVEEALHWMRQLMGQLKLTVNAGKTRICRVPEGEFDF